MSEDSKKCVIVSLKDGKTVESEYMEEDAAQAEFERVLAERPGQGPANEIIRVGSRQRSSQGTSAGSKSRVSRCTSLRFDRGRTPPVSPS
jgi:hypothetical protein